MLLDSVKEFLRVLDNHNDLIIQELIETAKELVESSTGQEYSESKLEDLCIKLYVRYWFDGERELPQGLKGIMTHLEYK